MLSKGADALTNAELLAILIGSGNDEETAVGLMKKVLASCGDSIAELAEYVKENVQENSRSWDEMYNDDMYYTSTVAVGAAVASAVASGTFIY